MPLKVLHREYIILLLYCEFKTIHMPFFTSGVKISEEIETSTLYVLKRKRQKATLAITIIHFLEQRLMLQQEFIKELYIY